jgi:hypothetical protein
MKPSEQIAQERFNCRELKHLRAAALFVSFERHSLRKWSGVFTPMAFREPQDRLYLDTNNE